MSNKAFLDSNVIIYSASEDEPLKAAIAENLIRQRQLISPQVVFECLNVFRKKGGFHLPEAIKAVRGIMNKSVVVSENIETTTTALRLLEKYSLQTYDSKIAAAALHAECSILYSEDMQHGLLIEGTLTVINPFL